MTTFTWQVNGLQVMQTPEPNTVVMSNFTIAGDEDGIKSQVSYSVNLLPADPSSFTPFDQITQEQAILWTQEALGADRVAAMEGEVQQQIDAQKVPTPQPAPVPWNNTAPEPQTEAVTEVVEETVAQEAAEEAPVNQGE